MQTEAQKKAKKKYMDKTYKNLAIHTRPENVQLINNYCKSIGLSKAATIVNAIKYLIENNVNLAEWIEKGKQTGGAISTHTPHAGRDDENVC